MYKVTKHGTTVVGCNEDAWRTNSRIWFENPTELQRFGAAFSGSRERTPGIFAAQSGMNTQGLVYSRLESHHPLLEKSKEDLLPILDEDQFLIEVLHQCGDVNQVKALFEKYDRSIYLRDVMVYVDSTGKTLVVEPYKLLVYETPSFVHSNFCPSLTSNKQARQLTRFKNGQDLLSSKIDTTLAFCTQVSDTMHVCRDRLGDGTLLTTLWNSKQLLVDVFFYHNYSESKRFNLTKELEKGDHMIDLTKVFKPNPEFKLMKSVITPFNNNLLRVGLAFLGGLFALLAMGMMVLFVISILESSKSYEYLAFCFFAIINLVHLVVLTTTQRVFYFPSPYVHVSKLWISYASYIPVISLILLPVLTSLIFSKKWKFKVSTFTQLLLTTIWMMGVSVLVLDFYWGLVAV
jgi:hypothetical protein